jgi:hypothetical protein
MALIIILDFVSSTMYELAPSVVDMREIEMTVLLSPDIKSDAACRNVTSLCYYSCSPFVTTIIIVYLTAGGQELSTIASKQIFPIGQSRETFFFQFSVTHASSSTNLITLPTRPEVSMTFIPRG